MTDAPRIAKGRLSELGLANWLFCKLASRAMGVSDVHLFSTLARQRRLFRAWLHFSGRMMPFGTLSRKDTELAILRVAHLRRCQYELDHHTRMGRRVGLSEAMLTQVREDPTHPAFSPRQRALLAAVDALVQSKDIDDARWEALRAHYTESQVVELCLLVGQYEALATTITALRIPRDY